MVPRLLRPRLGGPSLITALSQMEVRELSAGSRRRRDGRAWHGRTSRRPPTGRNCARSAYRTVRVTGRSSSGGWNGYRRGTPQRQPLPTSAIPRPRRQRLQTGAPGLSTLDRRSRRSGSRWRMTSMRSAYARSASGLAGRAIRGWRPISGTFPTGRKDLGPGASRPA